MKKIGTVAGASVAAFAVGATLAGGVAIATAKDSTKNSASSQQGFERGRGPGGHHGGPPGQLVTGADAQQAIDAATAVVPGTVDRVFKAPDGNYLVMVETNDDKHVLVTLDSSFAVISQQEMTGPPGGHGGPHGTPASAEETQKVTDAVLADQPGATVQAVDKEPDGTFEAHFTTADGVRKEAHLDANYTITSIEDDHGPGGHGPHGMPASAEETQKVSDAIKADQPGATVQFVAKLPDGTFEAHFTTADGVRKEARLDAEYNITSIRKDRGPKGRGHRGQDVTGKAYRKAKAAALSEVKGTVMGVHQQGKKYFAMVRKPNNSGVIVRMNSDFDVTGTKKIKMFMHHGGPEQTATTPSAAPAA